MSQVDKGQVHSIRNTTIINGSRCGDKSINATTLSTQPIDTQRNLLNHSSFSIYTEISRMKPFSVHDQQQDLDNRLDQVYSIHKKRISTAVMNDYSENKRIRHKKRYSQILQRKCQNIIDANIINKAKKKGFVKLMVQNQSQMIKKDDQLQIAGLLISESKKQKIIFKQIKNKFNFMILNAGIKFAQREGLNVYDFKKAGSLSSVIRKNNVCNIFNQEREESDSYRQSNNNEIYQLKKDDVYSVIKSSNRLVNMEAMKKATRSSEIQSRQQSRCKIRIKSQNISTKQMNFKLFFKNKKYNKITPNKKDTNQIRS